MGALLFFCFFSFSLCLFFLPGVGAGCGPGLSKWVPYYFSECNKEFTCKKRILPVKRLRRIQRKYDVEPGGSTVLYGICTIEPYASQTDRKITA